MRHAASITIAGLLVTLTLGAALAGDNNNVALRQESPLGSTNGNTLSIDQSEAFGSSLKGLNANLVGGVGVWLAGWVLGNDPLVATQRGEGNEATLKLTGDGGELQLFQSALPFAPWVPGGAAGDNTATITSTDSVAGTTLGGVIQVGRLNDATLNVDDSQGLITQLGTRLSANLSVEPGGNGTVVQIGRDSTVGNVNVAAGTSVTYTQIGNNLQQSAALSVYSTNPANLTITQTAW